MIWFSNGLISLDESKMLRSSVGTSKSNHLYMNFTLIELAFRFPTGLFRGFIKEPDFSWRPACFPIPTFVVESGWSETQTRLPNDLFLAGNGDVKVVILVKWRKLAHDRVSGAAELYRLVKRCSNTSTD